MQVDDINDFKMALEMVVRTVWYRLSCDDLQADYLTQVSSLNNSRFNQLWHLCYHYSAGSDEYDDEDRLDRSRPLVEELLSILDISARR